MEQYPDKSLWVLSGSSNAFAGAAPPAFIAPISSSGQVELKLVPGHELVSESKIKALYNDILESKQGNKSDEAIQDTLLRRGYPFSLVKDALQEVNSKL